MKICKTRKTTRDGKTTSTLISPPSKAYVENLSSHAARRSHCDLKDSYITHIHSERGPHWASGMVKPTMQGATMPIMAFTSAMAHTPLRGRHFSCARIIAGPCP